MKKCFTLLFFAALFSAIAFGQTTQTYNIDVSNLDFGTTKSNIVGGEGFGNFNLIGKAVDGSSFSRISQQSASFWASFFGCNPCRKTNVFGGFAAGSWITSGNSQNVGESLTGLGIGAPDHGIADEQHGRPGIALELDIPQAETVMPRMDRPRHGDR